MTEKLLILDFGSQYTQLIARAVREANVYCEIIPYHQKFEIDATLKGIILSGSPFSVNDEHAPDIDVQALNEQLPVLGICYGAQLTAKKFGGKVDKSNKREYGRAFMMQQKWDVLFQNIEEKTQVWMSHSDSITSLPPHFEVLATTDSIPVAAFKKAESKHPLYGLQFHPEVYHSTQGKTLIKNFLTAICGFTCNWTPANFITETVEKLKNQIGDKKVIMALSGGVDSTVAAMLISKAIGDRLYGIFVDNGVLRKGEFEQVLETYKRTLQLNVKGVDAKNLFYSKLAGVADPEEKRKIIGKTFIEVFDSEAHQIEDISFLGQGTIYPDVIESVSVHGPSATIKSHHNVGGLPDTMKLDLVEPLKFLFKDEVRKVGLELGIPEEMIQRHPFPGPGLAIRILGDITPEKVALLQAADKIYIDALKEHQLYQKVWQAGTILLPVKSVGVMGDERTYEFTVALRAVTSIDGMTADWAHLPYDFLAHVSNEIINNVKGINRVVYDISSKPPATIEWE